MVHDRKEPRGQGLDIVLETENNEKALGEQTLIISMHPDHDHAETLFWGIIKNISELKRLLAQIDSTYNLSDD